MHFSVTAILYTLLPTGITEVFFVDINSNTSITHYFQILSCWDVTWIMSHLTQSRQCTAVCALSALGPLPVQYKGTGTCTSDHHVLCVQYAQHCHFFSRAFMHSRNTPWNILLSCFSHHLTTTHLQAYLQGKQDQTAFYENTHRRQLPITTSQLPLAANSTGSPTPEGFWTPQNEHQYSQHSTEDAGNAFIWHNSLTTLCLSMYKTYLCLCVLPQSWRRNLPPSKVQDLCSWWYNAQKNLQEHYQGKHCLWPGDCRDYKLKTQLQFYHCCYHLAGKTEQKETVYLGGVQHADTTNLDLRIITQKTSDRLKKFLCTTDWESFLEWRSPGEKYIPELRDIRQKSTSQQ